MNSSVITYASNAFGSKRMPKLRVCIINADSDMDKAEALQGFFNMVGIKSWYRGNLLGGEQLSVRGRHEILHSHFVIVLLTRRSVSTSGDHNRMINWAKEAAEEMPDGAIKIIPSRLEECDLPGNLRHLWQVDFFTADAWERLVSAFEREWTRRGKANDW